MGGKRSDQYDIDPGEAGATDYKFRDQGKQLHAVDKRKLMETEAHERGESHIPGSGENPEQARVRARKARRQGNRG